MNNIDTLEDNQVKLDTGAPTDSATRPYTIDKRRLRRYRASQTVFGRLMAASTDRKSVV